MGCCSHGCMENEALPVRMEAANKRTGAPCFLAVVEVSNTQPDTPGASSCRQAGAYYSFPLCSWVNNLVWTAWKSAVTCLVVRQNASTSCHLKLLVLLVYKLTHACNISAFSPLISQDLWCMYPLNSFFHRCSIRFTCPCFWCISCNAALARRREIWICCCMVPDQDIESSPAKFGSFYIAAWHCAAWLQPDIAQPGKRKQLRDIHSE